jgi:hypothetical protein
VALRLHGRPSAVARDHEVGALVEASYVLDVEVEVREQLGKRGLELRAGHRVEPLEARVGSEHAR